MKTRKTTLGTRTKLTTSVADLGCVVRFNSNNFDACSFSFVLNEALELVETPVANPIVHSLSSPLFSYSFEVFHNNLVSIEVGNNIFADVMINPNHEPLLFSTKLPKEPFGTLSAFGLKNRTQIFEFPFDLLDFGRIIKPAVRSDSEVVYSEVNAKNSILDIRTFGSNLFRECEQEETSSFFINFEKAFCDIPTEIIFVAVRDSEWQFNPTFNSSNAQDVILEGSRTREVVSYRTSVGDWFGLNLLDHSASLFNTSDSELAMQTIGTQSFIDKGMEFNVIPYLVFPSSINAELQSFGIDPESFNYFRSCSNLNFSCCSDVHNGHKTQQIFKTIGGEVSIMDGIETFS